MLTGLAALVTLEFLSAKTQKQIYQHMIEEEKREFAEHPKVEKIEMREYLLRRRLQRRGGRLVREPPSPRQGRVAQGARHPRPEVHP